MDRRWIVGLIVLLVGLTGSQVASGAMGVDGVEASSVTEIQPLSTGGATVGSDASSGLPLEQTTVEANRFLSTSGDENITVTQRLALTPTEPGHITVTTIVEIPDRVGTVEIRVPQKTTVQRTDGFRSAGGDRYEWTGESQTPRIVSDLRANQTVSSPGPERGSGTYLYADAGPWAIVSPQSPAVWYRWRGSDVGVERRLTVAGTGIAGQSMAFLGAYDRHTREVNGQTFELIVPAAASLTATPDDILDAYANASEELQVGERDDNVLTIAAPTTVDWAVRGLQSGDSDMWVRAVEPIEAADNTWLHEYVHSRQRLNTTTSSQWLVEASATYYAAKLALDVDLVSFDSFRRTLSRGSAARYDDVVLADQSTWTDGAQYEKGALVVGQLDRRIRRGSDGAYNFADVFAALNARGERFDHDDFLTLIDDVSNATVAARADHYVRTAADPKPWSIEQHRAAFETAPAQFTYDVAPVSDPYRIESQYRNVSVDRLESIVVDESVTLPVAIENVGGSMGEYAVELVVDGSSVAQATGRLGVTETTTVNLTHAFDEPGSYRLTIGETSTTITVDEPATPSVTSLTANRTSFVTSGTVSITATITADEALPTAGTIEITRNGSPVSNRSLQVAPGTARSLETTVTVPEPGRYVIGAGDQTLVVTVDPEPTPTEATTSETTTLEPHTTAKPTTTLEPHTTTKPTTTPTDGISTTVSSTDTTEATTTTTTTTVSDRSTAQTDLTVDPTTTTGPGFSVVIAVIALFLGTRYRQ